MWLSWLPLLSLLLLIGSNQNEAALTVTLEEAQVTIAEDTQSLIEIPESDIFVEGTDNLNSVICYVEHVNPQPNSDPRIGPFETSFSDGFSVVYNPDNGFQLNTLLNDLYQIRVCCYEAFQSVTPDPPACTPLFITVTQNSPPSIRPGETSVSLSGQADVDAEVVVLIIRDTEDDPITVSLTTQPQDARRFFKINDQGGSYLLQLAQDFRFNPYEQIIVFVNASDGKDSSIERITVQVTNVNERPDILNLPRNITIREDAPQGIQLVDIAFRDPGGFVNRIEPVCTVNPREESAKFQYDNNRRIIKLAEDERLPATPLDFETINFYNISCIISDGFLESVEEYLGVFVENVNEAPIFMRTTPTCQLYESPAGESFCDVRFQAIDPDNDAVTFALAGNFSNQFALTDNNRRLTFAVDYDLEAISSPPSLNLLVVASDPLGAASTATVVVAIADVNDNDPVFTTEITTIPVTYSTALGLIGALTATDRDLGTNGDLEFSQVNISPPDAAPHFNLFNNGEIHYLSQYPDVLGGTTALITAKATDKGTPKRSATSTIAITFATTTTSTTTTTTTTTVATTTVATTTTIATTTAGFDFLSRPENIFMFSVLMILLALLLLAALLYCCRLCLTGSVSGGPGFGVLLRDCCGSCFVRCCGPDGTCSGVVESCRSCDCDCDCCRPPRRVQPEIIRSKDYDEDFWRTSDRYESGKPFY